MCPEILVAAVLAASAVWLILRDATLRRLRPVRRIPWPGEGPPGGAAWARRHFVSRAEGRRRQDLVDGTPLVCDLLAVVIEAGRPARGALRVVAEASAGPTREVLCGVLGRIELGIPEEEAWGWLATQPGYRAVARDVGRSLRSGSALGERLRRHARDARAAVEAEARARARRVSVAAVVPLVACFLPAFLLVGVVPIFGGLVARFVG